MAGARQWFSRRKRVMLVLHQDRHPPHVRIETHEGGDWSGSRDTQYREGTGIAPISVLRILMTAVRMNTIANYAGAAWWARPSRFRKLQTW